MPRPPCELKPDFCYHITTRCNNGEFRLIRDECREVLLYALPSRPLNPPILGDFELRECLEK
ncbi:MAG: hypothetical protein LH679_14380, partial [Cyanobacteria bacterium CAN_BIN43]|nr:hypothetical protein [Cyanobacteria bacterium CAN_BIN43]